MIMKIIWKKYFLIPMLLIHFHDAAIDVHFRPATLETEPFEQQKVTLKLSDAVNTSTRLYFTYYNPEIKEMARYQTHEYIKQLPELFIIPSQTLYKINISALAAGHIIIGVNTTSTEFGNLEKAYFTVEVFNSLPLVTMATVIGWMYVIAWSVGCYPQIYLNWKRKSVVGLSFDYLGIGFTGMFFYTLFNIGMYWIPDVILEYKQLNPYGVNPVQLNDVAFGVHATIAMLILIIQVFIYERGNQRLSKVAIGLLSVGWLFAFISMCVALAGKLTWLQYLNYLSYIKLVVTLIQYIPQAYLNYKRKSTVGFSIGIILMDFTGGSLSLLQMFLISYNSNDWLNIFGDPTKFGLGLFSICFDLFFLVQHFYLYRENKLYKPISSSDAT